MKLLLLVSLAAVLPAATAHHSVRTQFSLCASLAACSEAVEAVFADFEWRHHHFILAAPGRALIGSWSQIWTPSMYGVGTNWEYAAGNPVDPIGPGVAKQEDWWFRFVAALPVSSTRS